MSVVVEKTKNQIEGEIAQKRSELSENLIELKQRAKAAVDWRSQFEERPGTMLAVAFAGGIAIGQRGRRNRTPVHEPLAAAVDKIRGALADRNDVEIGIAVRDAQARWAREQELIT